MEKRTFLVTGATGNVGGAVTSALLEAGHGVRALVRDAGGSKAADLAARGVRIAVGDLGDRESLTAAARGVDGLFGVTTPMAGIEAEIEHGRNMVDAAEAAGVPHLVFSSVASADRSTGIAHFESKAEIEAGLRESGLSWTITAPVFFYENLHFPWNAADIAAGRFRQALPGDLPVHQISVTDVGRFNAMVLERGSALAGERIEIASARVTGQEIAAVLTRVLGRSVVYEEQSLDEVRDQFADMASMYEWFRREGFDVEIDALAERFPSVPWIDFAAWAEREYQGAELEAR